MVNEFAKEVLERLSSVGEGKPGLVHETYDDENFGNATATIEIDGVLLHFVNDRGIRTIEFELDLEIPDSPGDRPWSGPYPLYLERWPLRDGRGKPVCTLEALAVALGWIGMEKLVEHYALDSVDYDFDVSSRPFYEFDKAMGLLRDRWPQFVRACKNPETQWKAMEVELKLQAKFHEQLV